MQDQAASCFFCLFLLYHYTCSEKSAFLMRWCSGILLVFGGKQHFPILYERLWTKSESKICFLTLTSIIHRASFSLADTSQLPPWHAHVPLLLFLSFQPKATVVFGASSLLCKRDTIQSLRSKYDSFAPLTCRSILAS